MNNTTFESFKSVAYKTGYNSYSLHFLVDNPYELDTEDFYQWEEGWDDARFENYWEQI